KNTVRGTTWILNTKPPRAITRAPRHVHVSAELNHEIAKASLAKHVTSSIYGITFTDTAQVHFHAFTPEKDCPGPFVHYDVPVINESQAAKDFAAFRNRAVLILIIEFPETRQHAERHVEFPGRPITHLMCSP